MITRDEEKERILALNIIKETCAKFYLHSCYKCPFYSLTNNNCSFTINSPKDVFFRKNAKEIADDE